MCNHKIAIISTPLSGHCSISINLRLDACATQKTESNSKVRTYYKWKEKDKMIYNEAINSVEYQVQLSDIKNNLSTSDTDINDTVQIIQKVILEAKAQQLALVNLMRSYKHRRGMIMNVRQNGKHTTV